MNRSKEQGTAFEREVRGRIGGWLNLPVARFAEEGVYDRGDLGFYLGGLEIVVECRDREVMAVHTAMVKAKRKAGSALAMLVWKRKKLQPGNQMRTQVGPVLAIMPLNDLLVLLDRLNGKETGNAIDRTE